MNRLLKIIDDERFKSYCDKITACEIDRKYCCHNITHFFEVARVSYIIYLEKIDDFRDMPNMKSLIYAAALLHDIGKFRQYEDSANDHAAVSADLALPILVDAQFDQNEINIILKGIKNHREPSADGFSMLIYEGDKLSRNCLMCKEKDSCNKKDYEWLMNAIEY